LRKLLIVVALLAVLAVQPLASAQESTRSAVYRIEETHQLPNPSGSAATNVTAYIFLLDNRLNYASQHVLSEEIRVGGALVTSEIYSETRTEDNRVAQFSLGTIGAYDSKTITITQIIRFDHIGPIDPSVIQGEVPGNLSKYTQSIPHLWESDDPVLENKALELTAGKTSLYDKAKAIFDFVKSYLVYVPQTDEHSALQAYNSRVGDCSEFTHLFSALCRAVGIPTMFVSGYGYDPEKEDLGSMGHAFAFIYLPGVGWAPVDLTWNRPQGMFGELSNDHLIELTSDGSNLVSGGEIRIPGRPERSYHYVPPNPNINFVSTYNITRLVAVEPTIYAGSKIQDSMWEFSVDVKNLGTQSISNVTVALQADPTYFEVPSAQSVGALGSEMHNVAYFNVHVKQSVENSLVTAVVTYDSPYGIFKAQGQITASATLVSPVSELPIILLLILLVCVVGGIAAVAVALLRR